MSVIYPTTELIAKTRSYDNYTNLCKLAKDYTVRYMSKRERKVLIDLLDAYKEVARYNEDSVNSDIVLSYFEETVNSHSVDFCPVPVTINGEIVDYEPPEGYFAIQDNLYRIISAKNPNYQSNECQKAITQYFEGFCKQYYPNTNISFFTDRTLDDVLRDGEIRKALRKKFATFKQAKENNDITEEEYWLLIYAYVECRMVENTCAKLGMCKVTYASRLNIALLKMDYIIKKLNKI